MEKRTDATLAVFALVGLAFSEALVSVIQFADNLSSVVRYALDTTRATTTCPFHPNVTIRVGDDAAELGTGQKNRQERWYSMGRDGSQGEIPRQKQPQTVTVLGVQIWSMILASKTLGRSFWGAGADLLLMNSGRGSITSDRPPSCPKKYGLTSATACRMPCRRSGSQDRSAAHRRATDRR